MTSVCSPRERSGSAMKLFGNALTAQRQPMLANAALAIAFGATIGLDLLLIPRYGGVGAAWASTLAYTAGGIAVAVHLQPGAPGAGSRLRSAPRRSRPAVGEPPRAKRAPTEVIGDGPRKPRGDRDGDRRRLPTPADAGAAQRRQTSGDTSSCCRLTSTTRRSRSARRSRARAGRALESTS